MSDNDHSYRMNIRIPMVQYELMKKHGAVIGLTKDSECVKHFLTLGLQSCAGSLSSVITGTASVDFMGKLLRTIEATEAKQLDVVEESEKTA